MSADSSHAKRKILARAVNQYDADRRTGEPEHVARASAVDELARLARIDYCDAAQLLADSLARRSPGIR